MGRNKMRIVKRLDICNGCGHIDVYYDAPRRCYGRVVYVLHSWCYGWPGRCKLEGSCALPVQSIEWLDEVHKLR
jgi:hypothetical protein